MNYELDTQAAKEADNQGAYLKETGKYIGKFTRAEKLVSKNKGTHGIGFTFETESKQTTRFDIWTLNASNEPLSGFKTVNAIMACMKIRGCREAMGKVERYDYDTKKTVIVDAEVFPELVGKPIGLLLRSTEYEKQKDGRKTGETGWRLELYGVFEAATEFTSSEILSRATKPEKLANMVSALADKPLAKRPAGSANHADDDGYGAMAAGGGMADDDIPF